MKRKNLVIPIAALFSSLFVLIAPGFAAAPTHRLNIQLCHVPSSTILEETASLNGPNAEIYRPYFTLCPVLGAHNEIILQILDLRRQEADDDNTLDLINGEKIPWDSIKRDKADPQPRAIVLSSTGAILGQLPEDIFNVDEGPNTVVFSDWRNGFPNRIAVWVNGQIGVVGPYCSPFMFWDPTQKQFIQQKKYMDSACR
jgi:hypothetical protein